MNEHAIRCLVISDFNTSNFCGLLNNDRTSPDVRASPGPYGQVVEPLMDGGHSCWKDMPEVVIVWTTPGGAVPSFHDVLDFRATPIDRLLAEVDDYARHLLRLAGRVPTVLVPSWVLPPQHRG